MGRRSHGLGAVVEYQHLGADGCQCPRGGQTAAGQAQHAHLAPGVLRETSHRSFSVERPTNANTMAMIQKRMTIVGSCQPFFSKWWCSGAIRNTRRPVSLNEATCTITETASSTNRPP